MTSTCIVKPVDDDGCSVRVQKWCGFLVKVTVRTYSVRAPRCACPQFHGWPTFANFSLVKHEPSWQGMAEKSITSSPRQSHPHNILSTPTRYQWSKCPPLPQQRSPFVICLKKSLCVLVECPSSAPAHGMRISRPLSIFSPMDGWYIPTLSGSSSSEWVFCSKSSHFLGSFSPLVQLVWV